VQLEGDVALGDLRRDLPPDTAAPGAEWLVAPRLVELCWQTAGILEAAKKEALGLPAAMKTLCIYRQPVEAGGSPLRAIVWFDAGADEYDARVVDEQGNVYLDVQGYRTIALPGRIVIPEGW
jgi:hypothetical protein